MDKESGWDFLSKLTDSRLIELHKNGDLWACDQLIIRYRPLVYKRVSEIMGFGNDCDDAVQEGNLGLLSAIDNFNVDRGVAFSTFAYRCVSNRIISYMVSNNNSDRVKLMSNLCIDDLDERLLADVGLDPQEILISKESSVDLDKKFSEMLTSLEKNVLAFYCSGCSYDTIAKALGIGTKTVDNALQRVRKKLK